ncbi:elongation factor P maturation arginine rhamnosyltransferase EarP [Marinobacterium rhizophilum]|uniref:Protein-arginine rhamnosyltransferase n=1 Tax=Marinobacterium rhizophilum TaxID=420402 RepID=A0ABY5HJJ2_9GAMM|nr:elongation factor P maturation arginine rhamnosyltransferase EarP [Marinobacterium rhizophilum]UTW11748.1 elongation factor P maturation arginine rhamnosyltransferase EarP [Marinobacterium rhizophilum]
MAIRWDIFCSVIDNFGDIGVSWRLARQLVAEHGQDVRLWVDDLDSFCRLCPQASPQAAQQCLDGVAIHHWPRDWQPVAAADVVIEAFACTLPERYIEAMARRPRPSLWLNLEYLSAEDWVGGCHGLPSLQPKGLQKFFFFPGFTRDTGGLVREAGLIQQRRCFQSGAGEKERFLKTLGITPEKNSRRVSLFAYENKNLFNWLDAMAGSNTPTLLLVPEGSIIAKLQEWLAIKQLSIGDIQRRGAVTLQVLPFLSQPDYDRLLWSCDLNAVRGEDSFVRAQWAARPLLWQIYPQAENAHLDKLAAFLELYCQGLSPGACSAFKALWHSWNGSAATGAHAPENPAQNMAQCWQDIQQHWPELEAHSATWCDTLCAQENISTALVQFYRKWL